MVLSQRSRLFIRGSFYFLYRWVIPVRVHLSDCDTDASLSQRVMFYNRFVKWMQAGDGTNNDALCLPATCYINVLLITVCMNQAQRVLMILCSALVLTVPFGRLDWECFHYGCQTNFKWTETLQNVMLGSSEKKQAPIINGIFLKVLTANDSCYRSPSCESCRELF